MASTVNVAAVNIFKDNIHVLLEQEGSKLRKHVQVEMADGEKHFFERLGSFTASEVVGRLAVTDLQDASHTRRMATLKKYQASTTLDGIDVHKMLIDPTHAYTVGLANAHGRNFDQDGFNSIIGSAATGKEGAGSQVLPAEQKIAHDSKGLTVAKLNEALRILQGDELDIDSEPLVLFVNNFGMEDLFGDSSNQLTSFDFQSRKPLAEGGRIMFRGIEIEHTERVPHITQDTTYRAILMTKNALKVAMAHDIEVRIDDRPDLTHIKQIATYMMFGSVRMEDKRVIEIAFQN